MRICLVVHGFPPVERTGVEYYTLGLCRALVRAGHRIEVFVPRRDPMLADLALRREEHRGFAVNWITNNQAPGSPREALLVPQLKGAFASFLDRERPEIVHFQHLIKLGLDLVEVARERKLPTVYTAHDYYPICHRYTLLRPDLSVCDARGDSAACARCDLALSHLNAQPGLGDYQAGVLRQQLSEPAWETLQGILAGRAEECGIAPEAVAAADEQRAELDRLRREAYRGFDLVLSPSRTLIDELVRGGFERERVEHQPLGFENADLAGLPPVRRDPGRAVRFAFLGAMTKQKGVQVLLDAFERLRGRAELSIWGDSGDRAFVELVRRRCSEVGAQLRGPYERADLPGILREVDALVMPSIWVENYPLVIREGFSAGRPVLASRLGAIPESVRDGVDGLLFRPGDAEDLARAMARCVDEPGLLAELARGIGPVKTMDEEARQLVARYEGLVARGRDLRPTSPLPESLKGAVARFDELSALPARELFVRVLSGLDDLRESWAGEMGGLEAVDLLAIGLGQGSEAQDRLREARNEIAWLRTKKEELDEGREELMTLFEDLDRLLNETRAGSKRQAEELESITAYERKKEEEVREAHERMRVLEGIIATKDDHLRKVEGELAEAGRYIRGKDKEYVDLERQVREAADYTRSKEEELRLLKELVVHRENELSATSELVRSREELIRSRDEELLRAIESARAQAELLTSVQTRQKGLHGTARTAAELGMRALETQARVLQRALVPMLARLHEVQAPDRPFEPPADGAGFDELVRALGLLRGNLEALVEEVVWRRPMQAELEGARREIARMAEEMAWMAREMGKVERDYAESRLRFLLSRTRVGRDIEARRKQAPPREESP